MQEQKTHYKMYKSGRKWIFAAITVVTLGLGVSQMGTQAKADTSTGAEETVQQADSTDGSAKTPQQTDASESAQDVTDTTSETGTVTAANTQDTTDTANAAQAVTAAQTDRQSNVQSDAANQSDTTTQANTVDSENPINSNTNAAQGSNNTQSASVTAPTTAPTATAFAAEETPTEASTTFTVDTGVDSGELNTESGADENMLLVDPSNADTTIHYTLTNNTDIDNLKIDSWIVLPYVDVTSNKPLIIDASKVNLQTFLNGLPSGLTIGFSIIDGDYISYDQLLAQTNGTFTWDQLKAFQILGTMNPGETYELSLPMISNPDYHLDSSGVTTALIQQGNYSLTTGAYLKELDTTLAFAQPVQLKIDGNYLAYLNDGSLADKTLQALLPKIDPSQILIQNINDPNFDTGVWDSSKNASNTKLYTGGIWAVSAKTIQDALQGTGYTVLGFLNDTVDGTPTPLYEYVYNDDAVNKAFTPSTDGLTYTRDLSNADGYAEIADALKTHDSTINLTPTLTWNDKDQFDGVLLSQLNAANVTATVTDPDGVLTATTDGNYKVNKAGKYTVTYTYPLSDGLTITKTATVTVVDNSNSGNGNNGNGNEDNGNVNTGGDTTGSIGTNIGSTEAGDNSTTGTTGKSTETTTAGDTNSTGNAGAKLGGTTSSTSQNATTSGHSVVVTSLSKAAGSLVTSSDANTNSTSAKLPQTSEDKTATGSLIGIALLGFLSALGFARKPRHNH